MGRYTGILGIAALIGIVYAASTDRRRAFNARILLWGFGLQFAMALFALRTRLGIRLFSLANDLADAFVQFVESGAAGVTLTVLVDGVESVAGGADELQQERVAGAIHVGEKHQRARIHLAGAGVRR